MVTVRIKDHVVYAYSYEEGQIIYDIIAPPLRKGENVVLSFEGIKAVPSSFLNAALLQLAEILTLPEIQSQLKIENSTNYINEMIHRGFSTIAKK